MSIKNPAPHDAADVRRAISGFFSALTPSCKRILVALSGGPDSVALLVSSVAEAALHGVVIVACWVDHGIRPVEELVSERGFVQGLCGGLGIDLVVETVARGDIARAAGIEGGVEAAARRFRYEALERARDTSSCDIVLTGHTNDDFLETMVMRFCSGAGTAGLRGIPPSSGRVERPLLGVTKAGVLAYLESLGQSFRVDSTNETDDYLRNRVRHDLLPALLSVFPSLRTTLSTVAAKARLDEAALSSLAEGLQVAGAGEERAIDAVAFDGAPLAVRTRALYRLSGSSSAERLPWRLVLAAAASKKTSGRLASGAGVQFIRGDDRIVVASAHGSHRSRAMAAQTDSGGAAVAGFSVLATGTGEYRIGKAGTCTIYSVGQTRGLRLDSFSWPLWIRSRRAGDSIQTCGGLKMVDSLASELRIAVSRRATLPVVEDVNGIVAVLGSWCGSRDIYRRNDSLATIPATGFLVIDLKGATFTDAVRR
ncbi:MAG: tRNA lysidine(34) synthetase TilS [Spirochaetes bacterium GWB1_59_5]|nr:MAG: tRNA lysidine(34) synthetase TilS [Spirochaetes bacterium GWB1_59_5]